MIAHYYQIKRNEVEKVLNKIGLNYNEFCEVISNEDIINEHIDIDKSWLNLVEVFKDIRITDSSINIGEIMFYGKEFNKKYEPDGLINFLKHEEVKMINDYLKSLATTNKVEFIEKFNSTVFTQFGKIDYSDSYDYLYKHFLNLCEFNSNCEQEESGVIVSIG